MSGPLPIRAAAEALGIPRTRLWHLIRAGAPVVHRGGRGRGDATLIDPGAVRAWMASDAEQRFAMRLAAELPNVVAEALAESHALATGMAKAPLAGVLAASWYTVATRIAERLRVHSPAVPEIATIPPAIQRLREIARG